MTSSTIQALARAVAKRSDDLTELAARLVREPSLVGAEEGAQRIVEQCLRRLGFIVERIRPDIDEALRDPLAGYPPLPYEGRSCVAGRLSGSGDSRSLHLSGHIDVVPVDVEDRWTRDPWGGEVAEGRLWGRGAGDMKGGLAALLIATEAFLEVCGPPGGDLVFSSVIEEEVTGNGMRAVLAAGFDADATLIGEPSGLALWHGGVGVIWARLRARGRAGHALSAPRESPVERLLPAIHGLRELEAELNREVGEPFGSASSHPFSLNLGEIHGGVWPASLPAAATLRVRLGFGLDVEPVEAQQLVRDAVARFAPAVEVEFEGFRARAYHHALENPFVALLERCHAELHGQAPGRAILTATTDARHVSGPCVCYGPVAGGLHGTDEWVDLESARAVALTVALLMTRWLRA